MVLCEIPDPSQRIRRTVGLRGQRADLAEAWQWGGSVCSSSPHRKAGGSRTALFSHERDSKSDRERERYSLPKYGFQEASMQRFLSPYIQFIMAFKKKRQNSDQIYFIQVYLYGPVIGEVIFHNFKRKIA